MIISLKTDHKFLYKAPAFLKMKVIGIVKIAKQLKKKINNQIK